MILSTADPKSLIRDGHLFSQHSLNTFLRCPRRFLLKYVDRQPWPVPEDVDPTIYEDHLTRGRVFHQWVARQMLGIDSERIVAARDDPELDGWWAAFRQFDLDRLPGSFRAVEVPLVVPLGKFRLYARYDLLAIDPDDTWLIVDWKTLQTRPSPRVLTMRMQTRAYLYSLALAGHVLTGSRQADPEQIQMYYWFANFPDEPAIIRYSVNQMENDRHMLSELAETIAGLAREGFEQTQDARQCIHCNYRTLCNRVADSTPAEASIDWLDEDLDASLDLDQLEELEY